MALTEDWIDTFVKDTEGLKSPQSFRLWTAISTIAGVLERKVWTETDKGMLYPNLFVFLSGAPAAGKSIMIKQARDLWTEAPNIVVGPDNPTKRSFLDSLQDALREYTNGSGKVTMFCAMSMACSELSVLFAKTDSQFFGDMTSLYDNLDMYTAPRASTANVEINKPTVNILAGVTPDFLADLLPESAWGQGFASRLMFIYGARSHDPNRNVFKLRPKDTQDVLQKSLNYMAGLCGEFLWDDPAQAALNEWFSAGLPPEPDYGRLEHYNGRREPHVLKLSMIAALSRTRKLTVELEDFERAKKWLLDAESKMPDVFKSMRQRSDNQLLQDLYQFVYAKWASVVHTQRKPLPKEILWEFLAERTTSDKIDRLIAAAYQMGLIRQGPTPNTFIPKPRDQDQ